jgi:hypothetical protein
MDHECPFDCTDAAWIVSGESLKKIGQKNVTELICLIEKKKDAEKGS